jgi:hypothetical protein
MNKACTVYGPLIVLFYSLTMLPVFAASPYERCMRDFGATPGPTLAFLASQGACQDAANAPTRELHVAALCVAKRSKKVRSPSDFDDMVSACFRGKQIGKSIRLMQCVLPRYMSVRSQAAINNLVNSCRR